MLSGFFVPLLRVVILTATVITSLQLAILYAAPYWIAVAVFGTLLWRSTYSPFHEWYVPVIVRIMPTIRFAPGEQWGRLLENGCLSRETFSAKLSYEAEQWSRENLSSVPVIMPREMPQYFVFMSRDDAFAFKMRWF